MEDPVLYFFELAEADRAHAARDLGLAKWLGLEAERRREGTALI